MRDAKIRYISVPRLFYCSKARNSIFTYRIMMRLFKTYCAIAILLWLSAFTRSSAGNPKTDSALAALNKLECDSIRVNRGNDLVMELVTLGDYPVADSLAWDDLELAERLNYRLGIANAYNGLGIVKEHRHDNSHAIEYLLKSYSIYQEINNKQGVALANKCIGKLYGEDGDYDKAVDYLYKALNLFTEQKDTNYIASCLLNLGGIYQLQGETSRALSHFFKVLELFKKMHNTDGIATALMCAGNSYLARGDYSEATFYLNQALAIFRTLQDMQGMASIYIGMGNILEQQKKYGEAIHYADSGLKVAKSIGALDDILNAEKSLSAIYKKTGDGKKSLQYLKAYVYTRDSSFTKQNTGTAIRQEMNFEFQKLELAQQNENEKREMLNKEKLRKKQLVIYFTGGILLLVAGGAALVYRSNERRKKDLVIIALKNKQISESLDYAMRIQAAALPKVEEIKKVFPESFVLFMPKDVVSGDFYFFVENEGKIFIAAADCTGHGVPGAFMSLICSEKLNDAVAAASNPGEILKSVNKGLKSTLHQTDNEESTHDGMDIALSVITPLNEGVKLSYAGANRPLWIIRKDAETVEELEPTKTTVGAFSKADQEYATNIVQLHQGDTFYLFTDGITDQFGGTDGKKLSAPAFRDAVLALKGKNMQEQEQMLKSFIMDWKGTYLQPDDILALGIRI